jgi:SAM-dependent methyltransferase
MSGPQSGEGQTAPLSIRQRFLAWWEGYELAAAREAKASAKAAAEASAEPGKKAATGKPQPSGDAKHQARSGKPLWNASRIQVAEKIWGDGFATPGGTDHIPTLVKPLGLNPAMSVLDLGAGLGGSTRAMAQQYGAWVTGLEYNPVLAEAAMFRSHKAGLGRQAPVQGFDSEKFSWPKRVDAIFSKEMMFTVRNKEGLFDAIESCLKPRGQLLFTDYVIDKNVARGRDFDSWQEHEPVEPHTWTTDEYSIGLQKRKLDIRITEDVSETHKLIVLTAIQSLVKHLETVAMDRDTKMAVVEEVQLWARRIAALDAGLRVFRFYAMKPAEVA